MQSRQNAIGLVYGSQEHQLDHLAAVCMLMLIPLMVTEEEIEKLAKRYYPDLEIIRCDYREVGELVVSNYDILFSTLPKILIEEIFFLSERILRKRLHSIWCPHGNSDKGYRLPLEGLPKEEMALAYGKKMVDFFQIKGAFDQLKALVITGNFRYTLYQKRKDFYQILLSTFFSKLKNHKTILYAPTWQDSENFCSFFSAIAPLIDYLPSKYSLIIKLHPYLLENKKTEHLIDRYENHPQVQFVTHFPPIYPLLDLSDIYIGDVSSIGYDFLIFNKPMFFLNESGRDAKNDPGLYLYRCGVEIPLNRYNDIYKLIEYHLPSDQEDFSKIRQEVYRYAFGEEKKTEILRQEILNTYSSLVDPELDFL